ncbi:MULTISPECIES: enoyl-CoA hydratase/isomerase family protein [unclassified Frankia]|uniref:enoyl-CoA hydratase/isomerase family protein n=1 Tax=unclassified Frankia TaxID=2632575 RepID=UPI002AD54A04|nr:MULTISPECIES: enoyl-CoA hydratase/isomerase family protein [unclassified Frankia]
MDNPFAPDLLIEEDGPVRIVTMNRPEALNAFSPSLHAAVAKVWRHVADDPDARAVVFTGAGRAFSAGGDMELFRVIAKDREQRRRLLDEARTVVLELIECPLPVIGAVNGPAIGLGCSLAVLCDLIVMSEQAYLSDPHVSVGLTAGDGGAPTWPTVMSLPRAKEYLFTGDRITAETALQLGIANRVTPAETTLATALELAHRLAQQPPQALQSTKRAVNMHLRRAVDGVLEYALAAEYHSFDTDEHHEAVSRFLSR